MSIDNFANIRLSFKLALNLEEFLKNNKIYDFNKSKRLELMIGEKMTGMTDIPMTYLHVFLGHQDCFISDRFTSNRENNDLKRMRIYYHMCRHPIVNRTAISIQINTSAKNNITANVDVYFICSHMFWRIHEKIGRSYVYSTEDVMPTNLKMVRTSVIDPFHRLVLKTTDHCQLHSPFEIHLRKIVYSNETIRWDDIKNAMEDDFLSVVHKLPGHCEIILRDMGDHEDSEKFITVNGMAVIGFGWLTPFAVDAFHLSNYVDLDVTFEILNPYVASIPMGVVRNHSITLGLFFSTSENSELYEHFFKLLKFSGITEDAIRKKPFMSDEGAALRSAISKNASHHFLCFRHIIEKFGSNSILGMIVKKLLFSITPEQYRSNLETALPKIRYSHSKHLISDVQLKRFRLTFGVDDAFRLPAIEEVYNMPHGLWHHLNDAIGTTTNHLEGHHHIIKVLLGLLRKFERRFNKIIEFELQSDERFQTDQYRRLKVLIHSLKIKARDNSIPQVDDCQNTYCISWRKYYCGLYGISYIPCIHTVI
jgi:hypothetical protein